MTKRGDLIMELTQINKAEFVSRLAEVRKAKVDEDGNQLYSNKLVTKKATADFVEDMLDLLVALTAQGIGVKFPAVLETEVVATPARKGRNPQNGEEVDVPASHKVRVTPKKHLKEAPKA